MKHLRNQKARSMWQVVVTLFRFDIIIIKISHHLPCSFLVFFSRLLFSIPRWHLWMCPCNVHLAFFWNRNDSKMLLPIISYHVAHLPVKSIFHGTLISLLRDLHYFSGRLSFSSPSEPKVVFTRREREREKKILRLSFVPPVKRPLIDRECSFCSSENSKF